jgi:hypothetical protein
VKVDFDDIASVLNVMQVDIDSKLIRKEH